jgi:hypothetical protein
MYGYLLKVYAFYVAVLGATFAATIKLLSDGTEKQGGLLASPTQLPAFFIGPTIVLLIVLAISVLLHVVKLRTVSTEYADALNAIRRAFLEHDAQMEPYLTLPKGLFPGNKWWNIDFFSYASVAVFSGLLLASLSLFAAVNIYSGIVAGVLLIVWSTWWVCLWNKLVPTRRQEKIK